MHKGIATVLAVALSSATIAGCSDSGSAGRTPTPAELNQLPSGSTEAQVRHVLGDPDPGSETSSYYPGRRAVYIIVDSWTYDDSCGLEFVNGRLNAATGYCDGVNGWNELRGPFDGYGVVGDTEAQAQKVVGNAKSTSSKRVLEQAAITPMTMNTWTYGGGLCTVSFIDGRLDSTTGCG